MNSLEYASGLQLTAKTLAHLVTLFFGGFMLVGGVSGGDELTLLGQFLVGFCGLILMVIAVTNLNNIRNEKERRAIERVRREQEEPVSDAAIEKELGE
jgi:hypothetical protein